MCPQYFQLYSIVSLVVPIYAAFAYMGVAAGDRDGSLAPLYSPLEMMIETGDVGYTHAASPPPRA